MYCGRSPWQEGRSRPSWIGRAKRRAKGRGGVHSLQDERPSSVAVGVQRRRRAERGTSERSCALCP